MHTILGVDVGLRNLGVCVLQGVQVDRGVRQLAWRLLALERIDILEGAPAVAATSVQGELLAEHLLRALRARADRWRALQLTHVVIEQQPGFNPRNPSPSQAHGLKMNNMGFVLWTYFRVAFPDARTCMRATRRKEKAMQLMAGLVQETVDGYDARAHRANKLHSTEALRALLKEPQALCTECPAVRRAVGALLHEPVARGRARPAAVACALTDEAEAGARMDGREKCDDMADAVWHALQMSLELLAMTPEPKEKQAVARKRKRPSAPVILHEEPFESEMA